MQSGSRPGPVCRRFEGVERRAFAGTNPTEEPMPSGVPVMRVLSAEGYFTSSTRGTDQLAGVIESAFSGAICRSRPFAVPDRRVGTVSEQELDDLDGPIVVFGQAEERSHVPIHCSCQFRLGSQHLA